jgi:hypothetical protein
VIKTKKLVKAAQEEHLAINKLRKAENKEKIKKANLDQSDDSSTSSSVNLLSKRKRRSTEVNEFFKLNDSKLVFLVNMGLKPKSEKPFRAFMNVP